LLCTLAVSTHVRLPVPVGAAFALDSVLALLSGKGWLLVVLPSFAGALWFVRPLLNGQPVTMRCVATCVYLASAAMVLLWKRHSRCGAVEQVRTTFEESGVPLAALDALAERLIQPPALMRVIPTASFLIPDDCPMPGGVTVKRHVFPLTDEESDDSSNTLSVEDEKSYVDVWSCIDPGHRTHQLFFYIHGGSWTHMTPRFHTGTCMLHGLAAAGWDVVACAFRKDEWPQHVDDALAALRWTLANLFPHDELRALVLGGSSSGGHVAALLPSRMAEERVKVHACVLAYPVTNPYDEHCDYISLPFSIGFLGYYRGQSLMKWWFERRVLRGQSELWDTARPLLLPLEELPPTLIYHGTLDSIVPVEHSRRFMTHLLSSRMHAPTPMDLLVELPGERHSFELGGTGIERDLLAGVLAWLDVVALPSQRDDARPEM